MLSSTIVIFLPLTFIDCRLKDCVILGGKSTTHLSLVGSSLAGLMIQSLTAEVIELQGCRIYRLAISNCDIRRLAFTEIATLPNRSKSEVAIIETALSAAGGIMQLAEAGTIVEVDNQLWVMLGDLFLRQIGIRQFPHE